MQHVIELACQKRRLKELVAALEWSGNETVLAEILKWAQEASTEANFEKETSVGESKHLTARLKSLERLMRHHSQRAVLSLFVIVIFPFNCCYSSHRT